MCPFCIATAALFATKAGMAGAVAVAAVKNIFARSSESPIPTPDPSQEVRYDKHLD
jgi:hypothetical protein